jgi:hypothetical protein
MAEENQKSETRNQKLETRNSKLETGKWKLEPGKWKLEIHPLLRAHTGVQGPESKIPNPKSKI